MKRNVYLDNAALTPIDPDVLQKMNKLILGGYGNPSSIYFAGRKTKKIIEESKSFISKVLGCSSKEIFFTSGGTESDNLAILGVARANADKGKHIITTQFEHDAVLNSCKKLEKEGFEVTYLPVNKEGLIEPKDVEAAIRPDTILISVMYANNEIGTILPIREIGEIARTKGIYFHTDACQAAGYLDLSVATLNVDLLTLNGTKIYGPTGVGLLYVKSGVKIEPIMYGGGQQDELRSGTENVLGIIGLAEALKIAIQSKENMHGIQRLRDRLIEGILSRIEGSFLNGSRDRRLPNNANITFEGIEGESMVLMLDEEGIAVSTGSACNTDSLKPSHVLTAIGLSDELAHGSLRFSLGRSTTEEDIDYVLEKLPNIVNKLRSFSPLRRPNDRFK